MAGLNSGRLAAGFALLALEKGQHLEDALERQAQGEANDRALARHIAAGVLRHRGQLDRALAPHCRRPVQKLDAPVRVALRIGAFERLFSRTAAHAAVDQAVRLVRALGAAHSAGLVNAVLRRTDALPETDATVNHPEWLVNRWNARYGIEATRRMCARDDTPPPLGLAALVEPARVAAAFAEAGLALRPAKVAGVEVSGAFWLDNPQGPVSALPGFERGLWTVMDPSAAAVADLLRVKPGQRVLDACAAPGGKTLRLVSQGAQVIATDRSERRLELLRQSLERTGLAAQITAIDWLEAPPDEPRQLDAVLLDAPCTGLGTLRRHPEIRWSRLASDPAAMALTQERLLRALAPRVRPGGVLVYAVCSPEPEEGSAVVAAFLQENQRFRLDSELVVAPEQEDEDLHYAARLVAGEGE